MHKKYQGHVPTSVMRGKGGFGLSVQSVPFPGVTFSIAMLCGLIALNSRCALSTAEPFSGNY